MRSSSNTQDDSLGLPFVFEAPGGNMAAPAQLRSCPSTQTSRMNRCRAQPMDTSTDHSNYWAPREQQSSEILFSSFPPADRLSPFQQTSQDTTTCSGRTAGSDDVGKSVGLLGSKVNLQQRTSSLLKDVESGSNWSSQSDCDQAYPQSWRPVARPAAGDRCCGLAAGLGGAVSDTSRSARCYTLTIQLPHASGYDADIDIKDRVVRLELTRRGYSRSSPPPFAGDSDELGDSKRGRVATPSSLAHVLRLPDDVDASQIHWKFRGCEFYLFMPRVVG